MVHFLGLVSVVLSFVQEMLDKQRSSSTIKVYVAAIAAFHALIAGWSVGRDQGQGSRFFIIRHIHNHTSIISSEMQDSVVIKFYEAPGEWILHILVQFHLGTYQPY